MKGFDYQALQDAMCAWLQCPHAPEISVLGHSILGREIPLVRLGRGERAVLYVGAHHGMESITAGVLCDFVTEYLRRYEARATLYDIPMEYLWQERTVYVIPMLNPDGVEYAVNGVGEDNPLYARLLQMNGSKDFSHWQANARGVDLNHNYDAGFVEYKQKEREAGICNGAPTRYSGEYPESEPETAALCRWLRYHRERVQGVMTLHTQGEEIYATCGDKLTAKTMAAGRMLSKCTGYRLARPEGLAAYGGLTDWCIEKLGRPSFTVECGKGENPLPPEVGTLLYEQMRRALFSFPLWV